MRIFKLILLYILLAHKGFAQELENSFLLGKFNFKNHSEFDTIPNHLTSKSNLYAQKKVIDAYIEMQKAAAEDSVTLIIHSATRNFYYQKYIWESKWWGKRKVEELDTCIIDRTDEDIARIILKYSAMPGTSRHHWGTDLDLNAFTNSYFENEEGEKTYHWLIENAHRYGFYQPYTSKSAHNRTGYEEEKWHWSYFPLADSILLAYLNQIKLSDIKGFTGDVCAKELSIVKKYVQGIAKSPK